MAKKHVKTMYNYDGSFLAVANFAETCTWHRVSQRTGTNGIDQSMREEYPGSKYYPLVNVYITMENQ